MVREYQRVVSQDSCIQILMQTSRQTWLDPGGIGPLMEPLSEPRPSHQRSAATASCQVMQDESGHSPGLKQIPASSNCCKPSGHGPPGVVMAAHPQTKRYTQISSAEQREAPQEIVPASSMLMLPASDPAAPTEPPEEVLASSNRRLVPLVVVPPQPTRRRAARTELRDIVTRPPSGFVISCPQRKVPRQVRHLWCVGEYRLARAGSSVKDVGQHRTL